MANVDQNARELYQGGEKLFDWVFWAYRLFVLTICVGSMAKIWSHPIPFIPTLDWQPLLFLCGTVFALRRG